MSVAKPRGLTSSEIEVMRIAAAEGNGLTMSPALLLSLVGMLDRNNTSSMHARWLQEWTLKHDALDEVSRLRTALRRVAKLGHDDYCQGRLTGATADDCKCHKGIAVRALKGKP